MYHYTGIGARHTPDDILKQMTTLASNLELTGLTLRSGGANGADSAFEAGISDPKNAEIYLPWHNFNNNPSALSDIHSEAYEMAKQFHPNWNACSQAARKFPARDCYQILGLDLNTPSDFVLCWTPDGKWIGGTSQALRIAYAYKIPIFNMADKQWEDDSEFNNFMTAYLAA